MVEVAASIRAPSGAMKILAVTQSSIVICLAEEWSGYEGSQGSEFSVINSSTKLQALNSSSLISRRAWISY
jgi:hypothetical protein